VAVYLAAREVLAVEQNLRADYGRTFRIRPQGICLLRILDGCRIKLRWFGHAVRHALASRTPDAPLHWNSREERPKQRERGPTVHARIESGTPAASLREFLRRVILFAG
jgi:hypothetical protein